MQILKLQTIYSENVYNYPEFNQFIDEEVEITIKKINHKKENSKSKVIFDLQKIVRNYNANNYSLSEELINDRKKESGNVGLSLGDRACIATCIEKKLPILTADKVWKDIALPVEIILIR